MSTALCYLTIDQLKELSGHDTPETVEKWFEDRNYFVFGYFNRWPLIMMLYVVANEKAGWDAVKQVPRFQMIKSWVFYEAERREKAEKDAEKAQQKAARRRESKLNEKARRRKWRKENKGIIAAHANARRARKIQAIPPWCDMDHVSFIYQEAARRSKARGKKYVVDHIAPLTSDLVCGLHCPDNLQVITEEENARKYNHYTPRWEF